MAGQPAIPNAGSYASHAPSKRGKGRLIKRISATAQVLVEKLQHKQSQAARTKAREEIAQAEKSRLKLLAHISTNIVTTPEPASKTTEGPGFRQAVAAVAKAEPKKTDVKTGISDGLNVEVISGLKQGDKVVERPPKEIS